jgi:hypothetical protein
LFAIIAPASPATFAVSDSRMNASAGSHLRLIRWSRAGTAPPSSGAVGWGLTYRVTVLDMHLSNVRELLKSH